MLKKTDSDRQDNYAVYYLVYGSLAGENAIAIEYFWSGPYSDLKSASKQAEKLKIHYGNDDSFVVRKYRG